MSPARCRRLGILPVSRSCINGASAKTATLVIGSADGQCKARPLKKNSGENEDIVLSVAFTREEDVEAAAAFLPDRPISAHPNLVTASGLARLDAELIAARAAYNAAQSAGGVSADRTAMARATRDLRYVSVRRASAQLVEADPAVATLQFGQTVTFDRQDGRRQTFRIVGEDEADAGSGTVSYVSPLARALMGKAAGDVAVLAGAEVEIVSIG